MSIVYEDLKRLRNLDCTGVKDLRGRAFHNRLIINSENTNFAGCVLYHCFPRGISNALEINPAHSEEDLGFRLRGAKLLNANLVRANLQSADLRGAFLLLADLRNANLQRADLKGANFSAASLLGADLRGADLRNASFQGADLRGADLRGTDLWGADLRGTDLWGAEYNTETILPSSIEQRKLASMIFIDDEDAEA